MEMTPNDLRQQQFEIKFRGYNPDDVEVFRDMAAQALEESRAEVLKLTEENKHLKKRLEHLISLEETLKAAVLEAQKNADRTLDNAKNEAKLIIREAEQKREEVIADMHGRMGKMVADINKIRFIRSNYLAELKSFISTQVDMVNRAMEEGSHMQDSDKELRNESIGQSSDDVTIGGAEDTLGRSSEQSRVGEADASSQEEWRKFREHLSEE